MKTIEESKLEKSSFVNLSDYFVADPCSNEELVVVKGGNTLPPINPPEDGNCHGCDGNYRHRGTGQYIML